MGRDLEREGLDFYFKVRMSRWYFVRVELDSGIDVLCGRTDDLVASVGTEGIDW